jgi:hypothetical protein
MAWLPTQNHSIVYTFKQASGCRIWDYYLAKAIVADKFIGLVEKHALQLYTKVVYYINYNLQLSKWIRSSPINYNLQ